jgi:aspartyl-tRNA(Asn)/glutamyl-tRNA(Gln) amidotransferase subunit B
MYQPIIGLEIHSELKTRTKMFCSCRNDTMEHIPNLNICPICLGHPGTLPVINKEAVRKVIKTGLALNCKISECSRFARKNYFYPDLPKGYQISQYEEPFCQNGFLETGGKKIRIRRVHLEEDTGSLIHEKDHSLVDFNRAGIPLMELVTEPDLNSPTEAKEFAQELQLILRHLEVSEANMERGELRVEANISLQQQMTDELGIKVEIKNLNSFQAVEKSLEYEIGRQTKILRSGKKVIQETRGWDDIQRETVSQREKEEAHDYRYFPEPDLPPLQISQELIDGIKTEIPELPRQRRERFKKEYNLSSREVEIFIRKRDFGDYFEKVISELEQWAKEIKPKLNKERFLSLIKLCLNYILTDLQGLLKGAQVSNEDFLITPENFAEFITLIYKGKISSKLAKIILFEMFSTGEDPSNIIEKKRLVQMTDEAEIEKLIKDVIAKNEKAVLDYKLGKGNAFQFLIGQVMAAVQGKANPGIVNKILKKLLS